MGVSLGNGSFSAVDLVVVFFQVVVCTFQSVTFSVWIYNFLHLYAIFATCGC